MMSALTSRKFRLFSIGNERALGAIVLGDLERLGQGAQRLDVALDAHVAEHEQRRADWSPPHRRVAGDEESDADFGLHVVAKEVDDLDVKV